MIDWNPGYNWTRDEFNRAVHNAFVRDNVNAVCLDVEHSNRKNIDDIIAWAAEMGLKATELDSGDIIRVTNET